MKIYFILILILIFTNSVKSSPLFDSNFYEIKFNSNNVENTKLKKINEIKYLSFNKIFKNILTNNDYLNLNKDINLDLINTFIKNIIFEDEKIINNNYSSKVKINYNKKKIITYLRNNNLQYVEFLPEKFLTIILNQSYIEKNLFSKHNEYYNFLLSNNFNFYKIPNLDLNDRYLLSHSDIEKKNLYKINKLAEKYKYSDILIIISKKNKKNIIYNFYLITNNQIYPLNNFSQDNINYNELFLYLKEEVIDLWKINNGIQNKFTNSLNCSIQYFNLFELKEILKKMNNILIIKRKKLISFSYKEKLYEISYYGNKKILLKLLNSNGLKFIDEKNNCKILLV